MGCFDDGNIADWERGGDAPWEAPSDDAHSGGCAAGSGAISHGQKSWLKGHVYVEEPCVLSFWWKVSSEPGDKLGFCIDDRHCYFISGDVEWTPVSHYLSEERRYTIEWKYIKNSADSGGQDKGWVDDVVVVLPTPTPTLTPTQTSTPTPTSTEVLTVGSAGTLTADLTETRTVAPTE